MVSEGVRSEDPKPVLVIEPPGRLLGSMPQEERDRCVMLLGLETESAGPNSSRLRLRVVFQPIAIRRGMLAPSDYYVATTGGTVRLKANSAEIIDHSDPERVAVQHDVTTESGTTGSRKLVPEFKAKLGATELDVSPGSAEMGTKRTSASSIKFASEETLVATTNFGDAVEWRIDSHRGEKAVRDFLVRSLILEATVRWRTETKSGIARARPSEMSFFDNSRRRLSRRASIMMMYVLWRKGFRIAHFDDTEVMFVEQLPE
jgi:hypothetical protein